MTQIVSQPVGAGNRPLYPGDRVVYTSRSRLFQGIIERVNPSKSQVRECDKDWNVRTSGYRYVTLIDNSKIFKTNE